MIDQTCGNYQIVSKIGEGGMGAVYLARHKLIQSHAVIKVLLPRYCGDREIVSRFFNEAKAAAAVKHPSIIAVHDFGYHDDGSAYIVMEHLDGEPLSARLRANKTMDQAHALDIAWQIADGLSAVHECGIVHRDLKPDNLFLVPDAATLDGERVKILDFGIAKLTAPGDGTKTQTGVVMGTPAYMAPEQCRGAGNVDSRADLYALGCILFEMLCGRVPFQGQGFGDVIAAHMLHEPPSLRQLVPGLPPEVEALVARLLEKDPDRRFQSAREAMEALASLGPARERGATSRSHVGISRSAYAPTLMEASVANTVQPTSRTRTRSRRLLASALVLAAVGVVVTYMLVAKDRDTGDAARRPVAAGTVAGDVGARQASGASVASVASGGQDSVPAGSIRTVRVSLMSSPPHASVLLEDRGQQVIVGTISDDPLALSFPAMAGDRVFVIRKDGYLDQRLSVPGDADIEQTVDLQPAPIESDPSTTAAHSQASNNHESKTPGAKSRDRVKKPSGRVTGSQSDAHETVDTSHKNPFDE